MNSEIFNFDYINYIPFFGIFWFLEYLIGDHLFNYDGDYSKQEPPNPTNKFKNSIHKRLASCKKAQEFISGGFKSHPNHEIKGPYGTYKIYNEIIYGTERAEDVYLILSECISKDNRISYWIEASDSDDYVIVLTQRSSLDQLSYDFLDVSKWGIYQKGKKGY